MTAVVFAATAFLPDYTNRDIAQEYGASDMLSQPAEATSGAE